MTLVEYLKQFQIYAWSKSKFEKFAAANFFETNEKDARFYQDNKGIIGWRPLYEIAKHDSLIEQKKVFLKLFKNRLTKEEIDNYFSDIPKENNKNSKSVIEQTSKQINSIIKNINKIEDSTFKDSQSFNDINNKLNEVKNLLKNIYF